MTKTPSFVRHRREGTQLWTANCYQAPKDVAQLFDEDRLFERPECNIVKDQRKIKVGRLPLFLGGKARTVYVKRYNVFSWRFKITSLFLASGARKALRGSLILREAGVLTAQPIGALENRRWGMLTKSHFFSQEIPGAKTADAYWRECLLPLPGAEGVCRRRKFLSGLAALFCGLHRRGVYHNDLKDANILVAAHAKTEKPLFYLLDLEGVRKCHRLSRRRRIKNLVQLNRTLGRYLRQAQKLYFLKAYLGMTFRDRDKRKRWVADVLSSSSKVDRQKSLRGVLSGAE